jgi:hypothetical protein
MRRRGALLAAALAALCAVTAAWELTTHACAHDALPAHAHVAAGVRHAQRYDGHPFEEATSSHDDHDDHDDHAPHARRLVDAGQYAPDAARGFVPLRIALEWHGGGGGDGSASDAADAAAAAAVRPIVQAWVRHALVPAAAAFWRSALQARAQRAHTRRSATRASHATCTRSDTHPASAAVRRCGR